MFKVQNLKNELELITLPQSFVVVFVVKKCMLLSNLPNGYGYAELWNSLPPRHPSPRTLLPLEHPSPWNTHRNWLSGPLNIIYIYIRQGDELQHYSNETSSAFQQQKWTKVHKYKHQMD